MGSQKVTLFFCLFLLRDLDYLDEDWLCWWLLLQLQEQDHWTSLNFGSTCRYCSLICEQPLVPSGRPFWLPKELLHASLFSKIAFHCSVLHLASQSPSAVLGATSMPSGSCSGLLKDFFMRVFSP